METKSFAVVNANAKRFTHVHIVKKKSLGTEQIRMFFAIGNVPNCTMEERWSLIAINVMWSSVLKNQQLVADGGSIVRTIAITIAWLRTTKLTSVSIAAKLTNLKTV